MKQYSISQLAGKFGLTRSTLLYYDSVGLLKPAARTAAGYRIYTDREYNILRRITSLRSTGISLDQIREIINSNNTSTADILHRRIDQINDEINALRFQQNIIIKLLDNEGLINSARIITKDMWVNILKSAGLDENGMHKWHMEFEATAPEAHQDFLESIGLSAEEIINIRDWSKKD
ncbi:MAG: MerR family transcriptional regulator [Desulfobacteraceae bacterium]|jgi:DNA-binding transcriptional MerR regulator